MPEWLMRDFWSLIEVLIIDVVLAGDNAVIVGLAASRVAPEMRKQVIFWGITGAVVLRIMFAVVTTQLLAIVGLLLAGGLLLLYVCWKMYRDLIAAPIGGHGHHAAGATAGPPLTFGQALWRIIIADVSMSLDNVLAVAGAAKGSTWVLVVGLVLAIILMAVASNYIAGLLVKYPQITWIGLLIVLYVALDMIWDGGHDVACKAWSSWWCEHSLFTALRHAVFGK